MTDEEYSETQTAIIIIAQFVNDLDLVAFLERISLAETLGPIVDPTLYREAAGKLSDVKSLAQALRPFQREVKRQMEKDRDIQTT